MKTSGHFLTVVLFFFTLTPVIAQFHFTVGMNVGGSRLFHDTDFKSTKLMPLYETIQAVEDLQNQEYTWDQFSQDFQLSASFDQLRFGFSGSLSYGGVPVLLMGEAMSSASSYQKMAYSVSALLGKQFDLGSSDFFISAYSGYKFTRDFGFGSHTLVNSIGNELIRSKVEQYFAPVHPLGSQRGQLFTIRLGVGKTFGVDDQMKAGLEVYGEKDTTDKIVRQARMSNVCVQGYLRYQFDFRVVRESRYFPNPNGQ
jgi:hypothetical protein